MCCVLPPILLDLGISLGQNVVLRVGAQSHTVAQWLLTRIGSSATVLRARRLWSPCMQQAQRASQLGRQASLSSECRNHQGHAQERHTAQQEQLGLLVWWLFAAVIVPIVRTFFYVTDAQPTRFATIYYRKPAWRLLEGEALEWLTQNVYQVQHQPHVLIGGSSVASGRSRQAFPGCCRLCVAQAPSYMNTLQSSGLHHHCHAGVQCR
jgi:Telomerase ribonucleoprotein complex - RNA binding domain